MAVMTPREKWTDERLDDLNKKVDKGFDRVDGEIKDLRREMNERFDKVDASFQGLYRVLTGGAFAIIATLIGGQVFG